MRRLSGEDSGFLSMEVPGTPITSVVLLVLRPQPDPAGGVTPVSLEDVRGAVSEHLPLLPLFRWRVQSVPGGVFHPVYVDDPQFDLDRHLKEHTLSGPDREQELDRFIASRAEEPQDRRHPLWDLRLIHGLDDGRQAILFRFHHCLMDGFGAVHTLACLFAQEGPPPTLRAYGSAGATPGPVRMVTLALRAQLRACRRVPALLREAVRGQAAAKAWWPTATPKPPAPGELTVSLLNQAYSPERRFAHTTLPLAELKAIKQAAGVTLNDVALAVVAGSLRAWLGARSALPPGPLVASVPVSLRPPDAPATTIGNHFTAIRTSLATDVSDPWERLQVISATAKQAKRLLEISGAVFVPAWLDVLPPALTDRAIRYHHRKRRTDPGRADASLLVSNARGLRPPCGLAGAVLEEMYWAGPPNGGIGLTLALTDIGETLCFALLSCADAVENPSEIAAGLHIALAELTELARAQGPGQPPPSLDRM